MPRKTREEYGATLISCVQARAEVQTTLFRLLPNPTREAARELLKEPSIENTFVELAALARGLADSYRNFDVGTSLAGLRAIEQPGANPWVVRFAANTKPEDGDKYCGEQRLMDMALRKRVTHICAFFIVGEPQPDHGSGKKGIVLDPCERCRWRMRGMMAETNPLILPDTLIVRADYRHLGIRKHGTVASLHEFHGEDIS